MLEQLEGTLLRLVASLHQVLQCLLAQRVLLARHNAALVLHQVPLGQATASVACSSVPDLCLGAHCHCTTSLTHTAGVHHVLHVVLATVHCAAALAASHTAGTHHVLHVVLATVHCAATAALAASHTAGTHHVLHVVLATIHIALTHALPAATTDRTHTRDIGGSHCTRTVAAVAAIAAVASTVAATVAVHLSILMNSIFLESYIESLGTLPPRIAATRDFIRTTS